MLYDPAQRAVVPLLTAAQMSLFAAFVFCSRTWQVSATAPSVAKDSTGLLASVTSSRPHSSCSAVVIVDSSEAPASSVEPACIASTQP